MKRYAISVLLLHFFERQLETLTLMVRSYSLNHLYFYLFIIFFIKKEIKNVHPYSIFSGYIIPKGWKVLPWLKSIHKDPAYYSNPDEFNPSRWNVSYIILIIGPFFFIFFFKPYLNN